jgi:hypothetical protein
MRSYGRYTSGSQSLCTAVGFENRELVFGLQNFGGISRQVERQLASEIGLRSQED